MKKPPIPSNEAERMELVRQLHILDTDAEEAYDGITAIASLICDTPVSTITIIDRDRQWFKSITGGDGKENPRDYSFCAHVICGNQMLEVPDSQKDERFKDNPLVIGNPFVRYYAGIPLELRDGLNVGTLCVIDHKPNKLSENQLKFLNFLALQVTKLLELRLKVKEIEKLRENDQNVVNMLTHELRNPLSSISGGLSLTQQFKEKYHDSAYDAVIEKCSQSVNRMVNIVNEFLDYSHWKDGLWPLNKDKNDLNACIRESVSLVKGYAEKCRVSIQMNLDQNAPLLDFGYKSMIDVLENLISNAAKYSKEGGKIIISTEIHPRFIQVSIQDFGVGIPKDKQDKLFKPFALHNQENRAGIQGSGLGLSIARKIVEKHGGRMGFTTAENKGTTFWFTVPR